MEKEEIEEVDSFEDIKEIRTIYRYDREGRAIDSQTSYEYYDD